MNYKFKLKSELFERLTKFRFQLLGARANARGKECIKTRPYQLGNGTGDTNNIIRVSPSDTSVISGSKNIVGFDIDQSFHQRLQQFLRLLATNVARTVVEEKGTTSPASADAAATTANDSTATAPPFVSIADNSDLR